MHTMFRAVPMALRPATPPPITKILAGGDFPAAVIWPSLIFKIKWFDDILFQWLPVKNLPKLFAASMTALYPAMFAIELSASNTFQWKQNMKNKIYQ